jgi:hypothetical protein
MHMRQIVLSPAESLSLEVIHVVRAGTASLVYYRFLAPLPFPKLFPPLLRPAFTLLFCSK